MFTNELLEVATILGSVVGAWFALVGWKLLSPDRGPGSDPAHTSEPVR